MSIFSDTPADALSSVRIGTVRATRAAATSSTTTTELVEYSGLIALATSTAGSATSTRQHSTHIPVSVSMIVDRLGHEQHVGAPGAMPA